MKYLFFVFMCLSQVGFSQSDELQELLDNMNYQGDTIRSVYNWITENIAYDSRKLALVEERAGKSKQRTNRQKEIERKKEMLKQVLETKKGVCEDYSLLFDRALTRLGYDSYIVTGYTKTYDGKMDRSVGHAWNAVKSDGQWKLYDLTWGAGVVDENGKFVRLATELWYDVDPAVMIQRHMPYDPIWQLLESPVDYDAFKKGEYFSELKRDTESSAHIDEYLSQTEKERLENQLERSKQLSGYNKLLNKWRERTKSKIAYFEGLGYSMTLQSIGQKSKDAVVTLNMYGQAKNNRFQKDPWTVEYAKEKLLEIQSIMNESVKMFSDPQAKKVVPKESRKKTISQGKDILKLVKKELKFLDTNFQ